MGCECRYYECLSRVAAACRALVLHSGLGAPTGPGGFPQVGFNKHRRIMSEFKLPRDPKTGEVHGAMVAAGPNHNRGERNTVSGKCEKESERAVWILTTTARHPMHPNLLGNARCRWNRETILKWPAFWTWHLFDA